MTTRRLCAWVVATLCVATTSAPSFANPLNPDLSVIGDTRALWSESSDDVELAFHELEIAIVGPVNPYARAEVYAALHEGEGIEVEEAKLLLDRYLPAGLGLTIGQYLLDVGQINPIHPHAYPFVDRPLVHERLFGADGARDVGVRLDWLAPVDAFTVRASVAALRGEVFLGHSHAHDEDHAHADGGEPSDEDIEPEPTLGVSGRGEVFLEPSKDVALSLGATVLRGEHDPMDGAGAFYVAPDLKARVELGPRTALVLNAEAVFGSLDESEERVGSDPTGWFASADLRPGRRWNIGGFAESSSERAQDDVRTHRFGAFAGLSLMEESTLFRLVARRTEPDEGDAEMDVILQAIFGLGPHAPHRY
jgi:hypothetical protein